MGAEGDGGKGKYIKKIQQNSGEAGRAKDHTNSDFLRWKHFFLCCMLNKSTSQVTNVIHDLLTHTKKQISLYYGVNTNTEIRVL